MQISKPKNNIYTMKPVIKIILDTRRSKKNSEKYPVKLRVTLVKEQKYYPIDMDMTKDEFFLVRNPDNITKNTPLAIKRQLNEWRLKCDAVTVKANKISDDLPDFSFRQFELKLFKNRHAGTDIYAHYKERIERLRKNGKINTASSYQCSLKSLTAFSPHLRFRDVNVDFLKDYERWFLATGKSISTVGIYLRPLRAIINDAITEGIISRDPYYPFGKRKYQIPAARNIKKALTLEEIGKIYHYKGLPGTWWEKARDFFIFSYLCNGMNMKDIALLMYKNIDDDNLVFTRAKTRDTNRASSTPISIPLQEEVRCIIERWKNRVADPDDYLFPILRIGLTPERESCIDKAIHKNDQSLHSRYCQKGRDRKTCKHLLRKA